MGGKIERLRFSNLVPMQQFSRHCADQWTSSSEKMQRWRLSGMWKRTFHLWGLLLSAEVKCCLVNDMTGFCYFKDPNPLTSSARQEKYFKKGVW